MKNIISILFVFMVNGMFAQTTLFEILDSLSVSQKTVKIVKINNDNYFTNLEKGSDFYLKKNKFISLDYQVFKINEYKNYAIYCILWKENVLSTENISFDCALFFDNKLKKGFIIQYTRDQYIAKIEENTFLLNNDFNKHIAKIVEVDKDLYPISSYTLDGLDDIIYSFDKYSLEDGVYYKYQKIITGDRPFSSLKYCELVNPDLDQIDWQKEKCSTFDNYRLFQFVKYR